MCEGETLSGIRASVGRFQNGLFRERRYPIRNATENQAEIPLNMTLAIRSAA